MSGGGGGLLTGRTGLARLERRASRRRLLAAVLDGATGAVAAAAVAMGATGGSWRDALGGVVLGGLLGGLAGTALGGWLRRGALRPAMADVVRHVNATLAGADWSAELLAASAESLQPLERLQRERLLGALAAIGEAPLPRATWRWPLVRLALAAAVAVAVPLAVPKAREPGRQARRTVLPVLRAAAEAPAIVRSRVEVDPPGYTRLPPHFANGWGARAEEGGRVRFEVETRGVVEGAALRFGDEEVPLVRGAGGLWRGERQARRSELYAFHGAATGHEVLRGPLARLDVTRDQPPTLKVIRPPPLTAVPAQAPGTLGLEAEAQDDYGVAGVDAILVVAHGNGEQVTFREVHQALVRRPGGRFIGAIDLAQAGLAAGVEGYLRFEARDNREPEPGRTRSATLRISVRQPGQTAAVALNGGIVLQPLNEMFRSERQIILDTRRLLSEAPHLAPAEVERRTQSLGFDQRALRLRYGALLGEEVESGLAVEAATAEVREARPGAPPATAQGDRAAVAAGGQQDEAEHGAHEGPQARQGLGGTRAGGPSSLPLAAPATGGGDHAAALAQALPEGMVHLHDSAESMSFFPDALRREMRAVLNEMWGAEGHLRGNAPRQALPFEERALRQLKDVQQRSRAFVPKLGFEAPEIDLARRLTGDLARVEAQRAERAAVPADPLRDLFAWSAAACAGTPAPLSAALRIAGERALEKAALAGDGEALGALAIWRAQGAPGCREARAISAPLWRLLGPPPPPIGRAEAER
jgi:hypothetical protein